MNTEDRRIAAQRCEAWMEIDDIEVPALPVLVAQKFLYACKQCVGGSEIPQLRDLG